MEWRGVLGQLTVSQIVIITLFALKNPAIGCSVAYKCENISTRIKRPGHQAPARARRCHLLGPWDVVFVFFEAATSDVLPHHPRYCFSFFLWHVFKDSSRLRPR